jgi:putative endonuclease
MFFKILMETHLKRGQWAEELAHTYLCEQGLQPIERNYRCKAGEIDLIMLDKVILTFVEVRYRKNQRYGGSLESIDARKQERILITANHYLQSHQWAQQYTCRFDVVLMSGATDNPKLHWISDAFRISDF